MKKYKYIGEHPINYSGEDIVYYGNKEYWYPQYEHITLWPGDHVTEENSIPGKLLITKYGTMSWRLGDYKVWEDAMLFEYPKGGEQLTIEKV